jgi:hypothetical protein
MSRKLYALPVAQIKNDFVDMLISIRKSKQDNQKPPKKEMKEILANHVRSINKVWTPVGDEACPTGGI